MNVLEKLAQVQQKLAVPKENTNAFGKYQYRNLEDIEKAVKPLLDEVKATIILDDEMVEAGGRVYVKATAQFLDLEAPVDPFNGSIQATAYAREAETKKGMDDSQLTGATSSYARKYALGGLLLIDNEKDADSTNKHGKGAQTGSDEELTKLKGKIRIAYTAKGDPRPITDYLIETIGVNKITTMAEAQEVLDALSK